MWRAPLIVLISGWFFLSLGPGSLSAQGTSSEDEAEVEAGSDVDEPSQPTDAARPADPAEGNGSGDTGEAPPDEEAVSDGADPDAAAAAARGELEEKIRALDLRRRALGDVAFDSELAAPVANELARSSVQLAWLSARLDSIPQSDPDELATTAAEAEASETQPDEDETEERIYELSREAEDALRRAVELEEAAQDAQIRELRAAERRTAQKTLELTTASRERFESLAAESQTLDDTLSDLAVQIRRAELAEADPVDPETLRASLTAIYEQIQSLSRRRNDVRSELETKREKLESVRESLSEIEEGTNEIRRRERKVIVTNYNFRELEVELAEAEISLLNDRLEELAEQRDLFESGMRRSLEVASMPERESVQGLSDAAVEFATLVFYDRARQGRQLIRRAPRHVERIADGVTSVDFWVWISGLFLSILPLLFFLVFKRWIPALLLKLFEVVQGFRSAKRNPHFTGRFFELLAAIVRPSLNYVVIIVIIGYVETRFPQAYIFAELVTAYFVYRIALSIAENARPLNVRLERADEEYGEAIRRFRMVAGDARWLSSEVAADIRSTVVEIFTVWLVVRFLQIGIDFLFGFTLIGAVASKLGTAILVLVVLKNLSQWRLTIARIFARVAPKRFNDTVAFVEKHAQRRYGLIVVSFALLYIIGHEIFVFVRRFVTSTSWYLAISRVVFRARFRRRMRERETRELAPAPPEYLRLFEQLDEEGTGERLHRPGDRRVTGFWEDWRQNPRAGYVVTAPRGGGKSHELERLRRHIASSDDITTRSLRMTGRMHSASDFIVWLSDALELDLEPTADVAATVEALVQLPENAFFIDEANRCFARAVEGYDAFEAMTRIVRATAHRHFWVLGFDLHAWHFVNFVRARHHRFASVVSIPPLDVEGVSNLILGRHELSGRELRLEQEELDADEFDRASELSGFLRYLHQISGGNIASSLALWRQSVKLDGDAIVISLEEPPGLPTGIADDGWFLLSALVQHGSLSLEDMAHIENEDEGEIAVLLDAFVDHGVVEATSQDEYRIRSTHYPQVVRFLVGSNFLYGHS